MTIEMYVHPQCLMCGLAKVFFKERNLQPTIYVIGEDISDSDYIMKYPGCTTLPLVIIDGEIQRSWAHVEQRFGDIIPDWNKPKDEK